MSSASHPVSRRTHLEIREVRTAVLIVNLVLKCSCSTNAKISACDYTSQLTGDIMRAQKEEGEVC